MTPGSATRADGSTPVGSPYGLASQRASVRGLPYRPTPYNHRLSQQVDRRTGASHEA